MNLHKFQRISCVCVCWGGGGWMILLGGCSELFELLTILLGVCSPLTLYTLSNYKEEPLDGSLRYIVLSFEAVFNLTKSELVSISGA